MGKPIKKTDRNKSWFKREFRKSRYKSKSFRKTFLIICEGVNTEPLYFKSFPVKLIEIESFGLGMSKTSLVENIHDIVKSKEKDSDREVWCVFDMDVKYDESITQKEDYNNAIKLAQSYGYKVAYSNDCFELWLVLHYQFVDSKLHRNQYYEILSKLWNCNYEKEGKKVKFSREIYDRIENDKRADIIKAMKNSKKLFDDQLELPFSDQNPCTTIFQLVCELGQYMDGFERPDFCSER